MSILDKMTNMLGGNNSGGGAASQIISVLMSQPGGLSGILAKLSAAGLGNIVQSWISNGENMPITGNQVQTALGNDLIGKLANSAGVNSSSAATMIAKFLPTVVNQLTPEGTMPATGLQAGQVMGALSSLFKMGSSQSDESPYREGLPRA
jgi:uncharacterized protein YidB (DUF937 family)